MGVVHGGGWFIRSSHVALIYSPKPRIYFIHYAFVVFFLLIELTTVFGPSGPFFTGISFP